MSVTELLPALRELTRADKLRVMEFLAQELVTQEEAVLAAGESYPIWSPYGAHEAAATLLATLGTTKGPTDGEC